MFRLKLAIGVISLCFTWSFTDSARATQFSSIVIDATTGRTLHQYRANQQRYPASLAKMMTLYMMFEEIEQGRMKPDTKIRVSRQASHQPPSKLGLRYRSTISARDAKPQKAHQTASSVRSTVRPGS